MHRIDDEFLLLSRGGRFSPGTHARLLRERSAHEEARRVLAAREAAGREPVTRRAREAVARAVRSALSTGAVRRRVPSREQ